MLSVNNYEMDGRKSFDFIPPGIFHTVDSTSNQVGAIHKVREKAEFIVANHPEVIEYYKNPKIRLIDIAYMILPRMEVDNYPEVCSKAVGLAIRLLNPKDEQIELTSAHRSHQGRVNLDVTNHDFSIRCSNSAKKRHELHGVDTEVMIRARGRTPWSLEERECVSILVEKLNFQHQSGSIKGTPNYSRIAQELNRFFHDDEEVRTTNSVASLVKDMRRGKR